MCGEYECHFYLRLEFFLKHSQKINSFREKLKEDVLFLIKNIREKHIMCYLSFDGYIAGVFLDFEEKIFGVDWIEVDNGDVDQIHYLSPYMKHTKLTVDPKEYNANRVTLN